MKNAALLALALAFAACHSGDPRGTADLVDAPVYDGGNGMIPPFDSGAGCSGTCYSEGGLPPGSCAPNEYSCVVTEGGEVATYCDEHGVRKEQSPCSGTCIPGALPESGCSFRPSCHANVGGADSCPASGGAPSCCDGFFAAYAFNRLGDPALPAEVSEFQLDRFEVTVGRFRRFVEDGRGTNARPPHPASGSNVHSLGTAWDALWAASLPLDTPALRAGLATCPFSTWTDKPGPREYHPINCVTWYEAFAFCVWDGGRLPSEAEWNGAAADGAAERVYPWSTPADSTTIGPKQAVYDCTGDGSAAGQCALLDLLPVGSRSPFGDTPHHAADLAGNVAEWTFDAFSDPPPASCVDCAVASPATVRVTRGGSWRSPADALRNDRRAAKAPEARDDGVGFRCAR